MKQLLLFACAAFALSSCSDTIDGGDLIPNPDICPATHIETLSFEASEGLTDLEAVAVKLGDATVSGGAAAGTHSNVFWAKSISNYADYVVDGTYDGYLFSTADENIWFSTSCSTSTYGDSWGGFVITANYNRTATKMDYLNQFSVWAAGGANGTANCLVAFDGSYTGVDARPTIDFAVEPRTMCHCYIAHTTVTYPYTPTEVDAATYYYKVVIVGLLDQVETGRVECTLVEGADKIADWKRVDLSALGTVDCLKFEPATNDVNEWGSMAPGYFAIDEIAFVAKK